MFDVTGLDLLSRIRPRPVPVRPAEADGKKEAFSPSPEIQQAVMAQAQGGSPPGADPAAAGGPGGPPPGPDAGGAMPPGAAPAGPPPDAGAPPPDQGAPDPISAVMQRLDRMEQMIQQGQGGGVGPNGKPQTMPIKVEPAHWKQFLDQHAHQTRVLQAIADAMGLEVPASSLLQPGSPMPGQEPTPHAGHTEGGASAGGPPPSQIAQQLPSLPPVAQKAAVDTARINKLASGLAVGAAEGSEVNWAVRIANIARLGKK